MSVIILSHRVENFQSWKKIYDEDVQRRNEAGLKEVVCGPKIGDPDLVYMVFETNDLDKAQKMIENEELKEVMQKAGVTGHLEVVMIK
ncbi:hypothetical protein [Salinimicrobium soli]|uniref:hypothetical protein n=1 Tax=Salinimicrobium soli TaxID=1254399 RepID=UPI003AAC5252